ncbi:MAG: class I SAM-dependent methyltransferase [Geobacteraceae bacterium]|nr:class I SAM-dependent methyltransferase [Geobacteraceae bacterium]
MADIRQGSLPVTNTTIFELITSRNIIGKKVLDIGAGGGYMAQKLGTYLQGQGCTPSDTLSACDLFPEVFGYEGIVCDKMAFMDRLPYNDSAFDVVYAIEVMEHLANPYEFIREVYRIVKPGGCFIISVPNALNLNSRLSFLFCGFFSMFGPLSYDDSDAGRLSGHIMPLNYYYLDHRIRKTGFVQTRLVADKLKRSARFLYALLGPFIKFASWRFKERLLRKNPQLFEANIAAIENVNGRELLCSRSCILVAEKPR